METNWLIYRFNIRVSLFKKFAFINLLHSKAFKSNEKCFLFHVKSSFRSKIFTFLPGLFGYVEKWLDKKTMVNYNIYGVTDQTKNS